MCSGMNRWGQADKLPFGVFMNKGLTMKSGQTHMQRYTHHVELKDAADAYKTFRDKKDGCVSFVLKP